MSSEQIIDFITNVGIPGAAFVFLLYWVTHSLNGKLDRLASAVEANTIVTREVASNLRQARPDVIVQQTRGEA